MSKYEKNQFSITSFTVVRLSGWKFKFYTPSHAERIADSLRYELRFVRTSVIKIVLKNVVCRHHQKRTKI